MQQAGFRYNWQILAMEVMSNAQARMVQQQIAQHGWGNPQGLEKLARYADELQTWQKRINLIAPSTLTELWVRHILDSAQVMPHLPAGPCHVADLGSGGGLPVVVMACLDDQNRQFSAVESVGKKAQFLRHCARVLDLNLTVHNQRIEDLPPLGAQCITARALADLPRLVSWALPHLAPQGQMLFLKGAGAADEIAALPAELSDIWAVSCYPSTTDTQASLVKMVQRDTAGA